MSSRYPIDRVPVAGAAGDLYACGFSAVGSDPAAALESVEASVLVCLITAAEIHARYPAYEQWLLDNRDNNEAAAIWLPIDDGETTDDEAVLELVRQLNQRLVDGDNVVVHCGAGLARTAVVCVLTMVSLGAELEAATAEFRKARLGGGPDGPAQARQIERLAQRL